MAGVSGQVISWEQSCWELPDTAGVRCEIRKVVLSYVQKWLFWRRHITGIISVTFTSLFVTPPPVIPCLVSQWSVWSGCAEPCKTTYRVRRRHVIQEPRNGGEACPPLEERAGCVEYWTRQGTECKQSLSKSSENISVWVIGGEDSCLGQQS